MTKLQWFLAILSVAIVGSLSGAFAIDRAPGKTITIDGGKNAPDIKIIGERVSVKHKSIEVKNAQLTTSDGMVRAFADSVFIDRTKKIDGGGYRWVDLSGKVRILIDPPAESEMQATGAKGRLDLLAKQVKLDGNIEVVTIRHNSAGKLVSITSRGDSVQISTMDKLDKGQTRVHIDEQANNQPVKNPGKNTK